MSRSSCNMRTKVSSMPGGGAPDVLPLPGNVVQQQVFIADAPQPRLVIGAVEHMAQRHFEHPGHLGRIELQRERRRHQRRAPASRESR